MQNVGLSFLLPLAVEALLDNPKAEGKFYEGDLLSAVTTRDPGSWSIFPDLARELGTVVSRLTDLPGELQRDATSFLETVGHAQSSGAGQGGGQRGARQRAPSTRR